MLLENEFTGRNLGASDVLKQARGLSMQVHVEVDSLSSLDYMKTIQLLLCKKSIII